MYVFTSVIIGYLFWICMYVYKYFHGPYYVLVGHVALAALIVEQVQSVYGCSGDDRDANHSDVCMVLYCKYVLYVCIRFCVQDL
jgi:hypothetical protein